MTDFPIHPAAKIFPMIAEDDFAALKKDIQEHGQVEDIVLLDGKILDGRNRLRACRELQIEPECCELDGCEDPIAYVLSKNLHRRHLTQSQRAQCAAEVATLRNGEAGNGRKVAMQICIPIDAAAKAFSVSSRSVATAKHVSEQGDKTVVDAVKAGTISVNAAAKLVDAVPDKSEQKKLVKQGKEAITSATKAARRKTIDAKEQRRRKPQSQGTPDFCTDMDAAFSSFLAKHSPHAIVVRGWLESHLRDLDQ